MDLAINKLIVLIMVMVVLVGIIMLLTGSIGGIGKGLNDESSVRNCCHKYKANNCDYEKIGAITCIPPTETSLGISLGEMALGVYNEKQLDILCGCTGKEYEDEQ